MHTAWKVSKYRVISGPYLDTFHAVADISYYIFLELLLRCNQSQLFLYNNCSSADIGFKPLLKLSVK